MRKKIAILLLLVILGGTALSADGVGNTFGVIGGILGTGCTLLGVLGLLGPTFDDGLAGLSSSDPGIYYGMFGGLTVIGIVLLITSFNSMDKNNDKDSWASAIEENPVLKHVSFGTNGKDSYLGARFSF
jgi:hypothetical protein